MALTRLCSLKQGTKNPAVYKLTLLPYQYCKVFHGYSNKLIYKRQIHSMKTTEKLIGLLLVLLMQGCVVYRTQTADIPLISSKNEIKIDGGVSLAPSANMTVSYGLTNKIAVQAFGSHTSSTDNYYQGAAGIYKNLNKNNVLELYAGVGSGHASAYKDATGGHLRGNYQTYFTQFNFGKIKNKTSHVEYGFAIKT